MVIQLFTCLAAARLVRLIPLFINRQAYSFEMVRRIKNTVPLGEFLAAVFVLASLMLPFAAFLATLHNRSMFE